MSEEMALKKFSERYGDITALRAVIQVIPHVGGAIDTLLAESGQKIKWKRVEDFLQKLDDRLSGLEKSPTITNLSEDEGAFDLLSVGLERATKTRSEEKRRYFANVIARQLDAPKEWDEAETALRLVSELSELHIHILKTVIDAPICGEPFADLKVICVSSEDAEPIKSKGIPPTDISKVFSSVSESILKFHISELAAKGLLKDEGIGRMGISGMIFFTTTDMAFWLFDWVSEK